MFLYPTQFTSGEVHDAVADESADEVVWRVEHVDDCRASLHENAPPGVDDLPRLIVLCTDDTCTEVPIIWWRRRLDCGVLRQVQIDDVLLVGRRQRVAQLHEICVRSKLRHMIQYCADPIHSTLLALNIHTLLCVSQFIIQTASSLKQFAYNVVAILSPNSITPTLWRDFVETISTCWDGLKVWNFPWRTRLMIYHRLCPRLSAKVDVMKFGLYVTVSLQRAYLKS